MSSLLQSYYDTQFQKASSKTFAVDSIETVIYNVHRRVAADRSRISLQSITDIDDLRTALEEIRTEFLRNTLM